MSLNVFTVRNSKKNFDRLTVVLEVGEEKRSLHFMGKGSIKLAEVKSVDNDADVELFAPLNSYFEMALSPEQHKELFELYRAGAEIIENGEFVSYEKELQRIEPIIHAILTLVKPANLMNYFEHSSKYMVIPKDLKTTTGHGYYPRETTFIVEDYVEIVKGTFLIRTVFPIFFGLLYRMESFTGSSYAELLCGRLLSKSAVITGTKAWKRLESYVSHSFMKNSQADASIQVGSTEHTMVMILYRIVFNRLSVAIIPETEKGKSIINAISSEVKQFENNNNGYRKKESYGDEDDNSSFLDEHQITEEVPMAKITQMAEYFSFGLRDEKDQERFKDRFKYQCLGLGIKNEQLVEMVYDRLPSVWDFQLTKPMRTLLQLTYAGDISERIYDFCDYLQLTAAICLAQVRLAERGYVYLPSLLCAQLAQDAVPSGNSFLSLSNEDRATLAQMCDVQEKNNEGGSFNAAAVYVKEFFEELESNQWESNLEFGILGNPELYSKVKKGNMFDLEITVELKAEFMRLISEINE